jgi:hypothetical protein
VPFVRLKAPFNNIDNGAEQKVLALVRHLAPFVAEWRKGTELREAISRAEGSLPGLAAAQSHASSVLASANANLADAWKAPLPLALIGAGIVLVLALLGFGKFGFALIGAAPAAFGWFLINGEKQRLRQAIAEAENALARANTSLTQTKAEFARLQQELATRASSFPRVKLAKVAFALECEELLGRATVVDRSGVWPAHTLKTVDLSEVGNGLDAMKQEVEALKDAPVFLSPEHATEGGEGIENLYGEEARLQSIVERYVSTLGKVKDITVSLRLVPAASPIAQLLARNEGLPVVRGTDAVLVAQAGEDPAQVQRFVQFVNHNRERADSTLKALRQTYATLSAACDLYAQARVHSLNYLHEEVLESLERASWCSKNFYCPRTIQTPEYLYDVLGVNFEEAHQQDVEELLLRLEQDAVIAKRLADQPDIAANLRYSHTLIGDLGTQPTSMGIFRRSLSRAITGSSTPVLAFSEQARLFFEPQSKVWRSPVLPYEYQTWQVEKYGRMLKAITELMYPMWTHLWTEKADFRKSEQFRSNEQLIRMSEKESEKLIEIGNQFRADMRSVRENLYVVESDIASKVEEIKTFCDGMQAMGVLSERQKKISDEQLRIVSTDRSVLDKASSRETVLSRMPQAQAELRGTVDDPLDMIRTPTLLISAMNDKMTPIALEGG